MGDVSFQQVLFGAMGAVAIAVFSYRMKFLGKSGAAAQWILGTILLGVGGWQWTVPMLVFFLVASTASLLADTKRNDVVLEGRGSTRDAVQVVANGGIGGALVLLGVTLKDPWIYPAFLGAVAAAASDTLATEVGTVFGKRPRLLTTLRPAPRGTSGAVSLAGLGGAIAGAILVSVSGLPWLGEGMRGILPSLMGGVAGSLMDSLLGAAAQGRFRCGNCGKLTEQHVHCDRPAVHVAGFRFLTNDAVNVLCTVTGALCGALLGRT